MSKMQDILNKAQNRIDADKVAKQRRKPLWFGLFADKDDTDLEITFRIVQDEDREETTPTEHTYYIVDDRKYSKYAEGEEFTVRDMDTFKEKTTTLFNTLILNVERVAEEFGDSTGDFADTAPKFSDLVSFSDPVVLWNDARFVALMTMQMEHLGADSFGISYDKAVTIRLETDGDWNSVGEFVSVVDIDSEATDLNDLTESGWGTFHAEQD